MTDTHANTDPIDYAYGFGYARQGIWTALSMLKARQYDRAAEQLTKDLAFLDRMTAIAAARGE